MKNRHRNRPREPQAAQPLRPYAENEITPGVYRMYRALPRLPVPRMYLRAAARGWYNIDAEHVNFMPRHPREDCHVQ